MDEKIEFLGLKDFSEEEKKDKKEITMKHLKKIERDIEGTLKINAKKHDKAGERCVYSFHAHLQSPINLINVNDSDWDLHKALHKLFNKIENQIKHKFKTEFKERKLWENINK